MKKPKTNQDLTGGNRGNGDEQSFRAGERAAREMILEHVKRLFDSIPSMHANTITQENFRGQRYALTMLRTWIERSKDRKHRNLTGGNRGNKAPHPNPLPRAEREKKGGL